MNPLLWHRAIVHAPEDGTGSGAPEGPPPEEEPPEPDDQGSSLDELPDWAQKEIKKTRTEAARYRTENKALADKATKFDELENASKSDVEKLNEKATTAEQRAVAAEAKALRMEIAAEKGLTLAQSKRLSGSTREELEADADELVEMFGGTKNTAPPGGGVKDSLRPAGAGNELPEETDPAKLAELHPRR